MSEGNSYGDHKGPLMRILAHMAPVRKREHGRGHRAIKANACSRPCSIDTERSCREVDPARYPNAIPLSSLHPGQTGKFAFSMKEGGSASLLCEIGLVPGTGVELIRAAPMWGPVMVRIRGADIALGRRIARHIFVEPTGGR